MGYNNLNYAYDAKTGLPVKGLQMIPIDVNENGKIDPNEDLSTKQKAIQAVVSGKYPAPPARDLYLITKGEFKGPVREFVRWIMTDGQKYVDEVGYIKLAKAQVKEALRTARGVMAIMVGMRWRQIKDYSAGGILRLSLIFINAVAVLITIVLIIKATTHLYDTSSAELLLSSEWHPLTRSLRLFFFIVGTLEVTAIAMILSIPVCLLSAIYLSEYAHSRFREFARLVIDILAGIPSVIYGLCGVIVVVPLVRVVGKALGNPTTGYSLLAGGIILAIMVSPVIISLSLEVLRTIPGAARENSLALGTTKWEMVKHVILRSALRGIIAAIVLGFARAFGETIAVLMVVGNVAKVPFRFLIRPIRFRLSLPTITAR